MPMIGGINANDWGESMPMILRLLRALAGTSPPVKEDKSVISPRRMCGRTGSLINFVAWKWEFSLGADYAVFTVLLLI